LIDGAKGEPEMIDGFRIEDLLERTGPLQIFRAKQIESGHDCAIAIATLPEPERKQFLEETNVAASVTHSSLTTVYGSGVTESGDGFVISEYSDSRTLRDLLNETAALQLLDTIKIVRQLAEAVEVLHAHGLVHGAIRPENISIAGMEVNVRLKQPDFAGAERKAIVSDKFNIDNSIGKLQYFAPEQFSADSHVQGSDVYSLGIVLFEMLAGTPPFIAETGAELIEKHRTEHPPDIKIPNYELRMLLANILMESLQKQPSLRLPSAQAFTRQMRHIEQLATHSSTPPPVMTVKAKARSAAASVSPQPPGAHAPKFIKETPVSKLGLSDHSDRKLDHAVINPAARAADANEPAATPAKKQIDPVDDLNKFRLDYWKEKYDNQVGSAKNRKGSSGRWDSVLNLEAPVRPTSSQAPAPKPTAKPTSDRTEPAAKQTRIKVEWQQPDDDLPSMDDVRKMIASAPLVDAATIEAEARPRISDPVSETAAAIPEAKNANTRKRRIAAAPMLSVMGNAYEGTPSYEPAQSSSNRPRFRTPPLDLRVLVAGIAAVFVVAILIAASLVVGDETPAATVASEPPAQTAPPTFSESEPQTVQNDSVPAESQNELNADDYALVPERQEKTVTPTVRTADVAKDTRKDPIVRSSATPTADSSKPAKDVRSDIVTATKAAPLNPSTLVIYSDKGKVSKRVESMKASNSSGSTRPRIVANPKP
jgi:serine/threonine-protein kinase